MKKPKMPRQPKEPKEPKQYNFIEKEFVDDGVYDYNEFLDKVSVMSKEVALSRTIVEKYFDVRKCYCGMYDDSCDAGLYLRYEVLNPKYDEEMIVYNKKREKYELDYNKYQEKVKGYNKRFYEWRAEQIPGMKAKALKTKKRLESELDRVNKELERLDKDVE